MIKFINWRDKNPMDSTINLPNIYKSALQDVT